VLTVPVRRLDESDRGAVGRLLDHDPYGATTLAERVASRRCWAGPGAVFGYGDRRQPEAVCWVGSYLNPVLAGPPAQTAFAELVAGLGRTCTSIVGQADPVLGLWERLEPAWGPARQVRPDQPLLLAQAPPAVPPDPGVRLARPDEMDIVWPAAVEMYTEEVGVSPMAEGGGRDHRARVAELIRSGRSYTKVVGGQVVFKADLAAVSRHTTQVQGVWVAPAWRGRGIATGGMSTVVRDALRRVAPTVTLYVNDYNRAARRVYARCGFRQVGRFATVLF
jgi:hypothetical protein